jgi:CheY-like chemotaxis protein
MPAETILIVDDDPICRAVARLALTQAGFATRTASHGQEALELLHTFLPDLILSDIQMPVMDGFEFARRTREIPRLCGIPMIALTAISGADPAQRVYDAGFNAYLAKPISSTGLTLQIRRYLAAAGNSSTAA